MNDTKHPQLLSDYFSRSVREYGPNTAIDFLGKRWRYEEMGEQVSHIAAGLQKLGLKKGEALGLCLPNTPYYIFFFFAALKIGAKIVNFNPLYVEKEIAAQAEDAGVKTIVTLDLQALYGKLETLRKAGVFDRIIIGEMGRVLPPVKSFLFRIFKAKQIAAIPHDDAHPRAHLLADAGGERKVNPVSIDPENDVAAIQYTGGTTGLPKGAMLTHANLAANLRQMTSFLSAASSDQGQGLVFGEERVLCVLPFFHVFALGASLSLSISIGGTMVLMPRFELEALIKAIRRHQITFMSAVPTIYNAIINRPGIEKLDLSSLKYCVSGGAPLPMDVNSRFEQLTGCMLVEGYGLTETSPVVSVNPLDARRKMGSIGLPLEDTEISVRDLNDLQSEVAQGKEGEVWIRGPQVMKGYWAAEAATRDIFMDGWLRTGDVGYVDSDGFIYLVDRIKDVIICSGYNVYPRHIEEALYAHEAIEEACVLAIDDDYRGQQPAAYVKLRAGHQVTATELTRFLSTHLSPIEMPKQIDFIDDMPKTLIGKISKRELAEKMFKPGHN